jgi:tetratricopeptide (TPR) repeat protein
LGVPDIELSKMASSKTKLHAKEREHPAVFIPLAALAVTFLAIVAATLLPQAREMRLWGINHLAFYPTPVRVGAIVLMALAFVPPLARGLYAGIQRVAVRLSGGGNRSTLVIAIISLASVFLFYELRAAAHLLGDGQLIVRSFEVSYQGNETVRMSSVVSILTTEHIAPGMMLLYYWTVKTAVVVFKQSVADAMVILPCVLGGAFVFFLLRLVRDAPVSAALKAWLLVLGLFTTSLQLYFGYVENYSAILLFLAMYVTAGFLVMHRRAGLWLPIALLALSFYTHIQSLVMAPSLLYLVAWRVAGRRNGAVSRYSVVVIVVLIVAAALVGRALEIPGDFYLPLTADDESYGIVSPGHLLDMINEILMLIPIVLFALAAWRTASAAQAAEGSEGEWFAQPTEWRFVSLVLVACLVYMVFFKPEIGMARDWDLFTMTTVGTVPLVLLIVNRYLTRARPSPVTAALVSAPAMVMTAVLAVSWVGVNASPDRTTERYESILAYDQTHVGYAYENLATFYHSRGELSKAIGAMETGARVSGNPRVYARLAELYEENGDVDTAIALLDDKVKQHPSHTKVRKKLVDLLEKARRWEEMVEVAREGAKRHPNEAVFYFAMGEGLLRTGKVDEGLDAFRMCLTMDPPEGARSYILKCFRQHDRTP